MKAAHVLALIDLKVDNLPKVDLDPYKDDDLNPFNLKPDAIKALADKSPLRYKVFEVAEELNKNIEIPLAESIALGSGPASPKDRQRFLAEQKAADLIDVDWEPLPAIVDFTKASVSGSPLVHDDVPDNVAAMWEAEFQQQLIARALDLMQTDFQPQTWQACLAQVVEGKSGEQVAEELGMSLAAVYAARSRVLRRLRQELDGMLD